MKLCRILITSTALLALAGCATNGTPAQEYQTYVTGVQLAVPTAEAAIAAAGYSSPKITQAENALNAEVAALGTTTVPTNASAILADVQTLVSALPTTTLSPAHQAEVTALLTAAKLLVAYYQSTQTPAPSTPAATVTAAPTRFLSTLPIFTARPFSGT